MTTISETSNPTTMAQNSLSQAFSLTQNLLQQFLNTPQSVDGLHLAFGDRLDIGQAQDILHQWAESGLDAWPMLSIRSGEQINHAYGAFAGETQTIYLSEEFLTANAGQPRAIASVLLEELGHALDWQLNTHDSAGDEGAIFAKLATGQTISEAQLHALKTEQDSVIVPLDGQQLQLEQATRGVNSAFDLIGLTDLRNDSRFTGIDGSGYSVAVIDTGLDRSHSLLQPNYLTGVDFINGGSNPIDRLGHGTHVAGIIGAADENVGVAPDVNLIGLQVFRPSGSAFNPDVEEALQWVLDNRDRYNIVAVNLSLGGGAYASTSDVIGDILSDDIRRLEQSGVAVVAASGNAFKTYEYKSVAAPAIHSTLAVGAVWEDGQYSNYWWGDGAVDYSTGADRIVSLSQRFDGSNMIFAPGALINSTIPGNKFAEFGGTSMASPMVSGAVALLQEAATEFGGRLLTTTEVSSILRSTADTIYDGDDEDDNVNNTNTSYRRLNVYEAVKAVYDQFQGGNNNPSPTPGEFEIDDRDPNGTFAGAIQGPRMDGTDTTSLTGRIGEDGANNVGDRDVDLAKFEVLSPGIVTLAVNSHPSRPDDFDSFLRLFDQSGQELATDDNSGVGNFSQISTYLDTGLYYVGVSGQGNDDYDPEEAGSGSSGDTGNFSLDFSLSSTDPNGVISGATPVNLGTTRDPLTFLGEIGKDFTNPVATADVDLFELTAPDDGYLLVDIDTPFNSNYVDSFLRVFDADGEELRVGANKLENDNGLATDLAGTQVEFTNSAFPEIVFSDPNDQDSAVGHRGDSFLQIPVERGKTYYLGLSDASNKSYDVNRVDDRSTSTDGGRYQMIVNFTNQDLNGSINESATLLSLPTIGRWESIGRDRDPDTGREQSVGDRDVDFFRVNSPTAGILEIDLDSYGSNEITYRVDTSILVFDGDGNLVGFNDDDVEGAANTRRGFLDPFVQVEIEANQDYFVAIAGYGNNSFDPYAPGSGSSGDMGDYILSSRLLSRNSLPQLLDNSINQGTLKTVDVGSLVLGNLGRDKSFMVGNTDVDLYKFQPSQTGQVNLKVSSVISDTFATAIADPFLRVFDASGNELAYNDDENATTTGSALDLSVIAGRTYYIGINGSSPQARNYNPLTGTGAAAGGQGSYRLFITQDGSAVPAPISIDITPEDDRIVATITDDKINARAGNDEIRGGNGDDILIGGKGSDKIWGERGNDVLRGSGDNDILRGGAGDDNLGGNLGRDRLFGGGGSDILKGGSHNDRLKGNGGNDILRGGSHNDILMGGNGNDRLVGGGGNDTLLGNKGRDKLRGNRGRDIFALEPGNGVNIILDFRPNQDRLGLTNNLGFSDLSIRQQRNRTFIEFEGDLLAILNNTQVNEITESRMISL